MIRVAYLFPFFSGQYGGPVTYTLELAKKLYNYPIKITVFASSDLDNTSKKKTQLYQQLNSKFDVKRNNSYLKFRDYRISFRLFPQLMRESKKIDIFHSHGIRSFQEDIASLVAILKKKELVITPQGALCVNNNYFEYLYKRCYDILDQNFKNKLLNVNYIAIAKKEIEFLRKYEISEEKIHYIPYGINTDYYKPSDATEFLEKYKLLNKKIILYVGRIAQRKGIDVLIEAFSLMRNEIPDAYLIIAGADSGYKHNLLKIIKKKNLEKRIIFLGHIDKAILPKIYSIANVVVYPSKFEIFGLVILEANACEKLVIASNHWGPKELIIDGKTGFLTKYGDADELKQKITYVLSNESLQVKLGKFAREHVKKTYSWEKNALSHYNLYKKILEK